MTGKTMRVRRLFSLGPVAALAGVALLASQTAAIPQQQNGSGQQQAATPPVIPTPMAAQGTDQASGQDTAAPPLGLSPDEQFHLGLAIFMQARCYVCHGEEGFGGAGPRFRENRFLGLSDYVAGQILVGRKIMPSFAGTLNDVQIAAVATYIRNAWGNEFGPVDPAIVTAARQKMQLVPEPGQELPPTVMQPENAPVPPYSPLPPGQALPPPDLGVSKLAEHILPAPVPPEAGQQ